MWGQIAAMGLSILGGVNQYKLQRAQYKAQKTIDDANYEASEMIRKASNELGRAQGGLANWMKSVSNQRMIEAAGDQYNALGENLGRILDQAATGSLQRRIQAAEQAGALTASAAAAGVGGSTVSLINGTLRLRNAMVNEEIEKQEGQASYDLMAQRAGVMSNAYDSWDYSLVGDTANHMGAVKPIRVAPDGTSALLKVAAQVLPQAAGVNWGKLFGGDEGVQIAGGITPPGRPSTLTDQGYTFLGLDMSKMRL